MTSRILLGASPLLVIFTRSVNVVSAQITDKDLSLGPVPPEQIQLPSNPLARWVADHHLRFFGWVNGGYT